MALRGKIGLAKTTALRSTVASSARPAMAKQAVASIQAAPMSEADCGCGCDGAGTCSTSEPPQAVVASGLDQATKKPAAWPLGPVGSSRALARSRREALSTDGKKGMLRVAKATRMAAVLPQQDWQQAIEKGASGRDVAKQRRLVRALVGRQGAATVTPKPSGRMRAKNINDAASAKAALKHTSSGQSVTGSSFNGAQKVSGNEAGAANAVTGTEFLSSEQFTPVGGKRPAPGPSKIMVSSMLRELKVTGSELGRTTSITGQEAGAFRNVTGAEYLLQQPQNTTESTPAPITRKVSVMSSQGGQKVSGLEIGRSSKVTGNETGAARELTGSQYFSAVDFGQQSSREMPAKVATVQTLAGSLVTGTEVGRGQKITGDDRGGCHAITGTEYISSQPLKDVCETVGSVQPVAKVGKDLTWGDQSITGVHIGRSRQVSGDESGACAPISGTAYIGQQQYQGFCEPEKTRAQQALTRQEGFISASLITGDRPGAGGSVMTGDRRGACSVISGSPYIGADNLPRQCGNSGRFVAPTRNEEPANNALRPRDFSIRPPSRQARERSADIVTGSAFSGQRITGAINKGLGLLTGTPEFRHCDSLAMPTPQSETRSGANKLTGEGSQAGREISGDAWKSSDRVTGTEGASSLARNPSQRGDVRGVGMGMTAINFRKAERVEQPQSKVTGSSGNTSKGASVTLSGGARG
jgi:hypothetical protein